MRNRGRGDKKNRVNIETHLNKAVTQSVPDVLDNILASCDHQERKVVEMTMPKKNKSWIAAISAAAAVLIVGTFGFYGYHVYQTAHRVESVVGLDVNPSLTLQLSAKEKVLQVTPLNEDAEKILDGMELKNTDLDVALNALIGSMVKNGYLNELANSILVSVENENKDRGTALQQKIANELQSLLSSDGFQGAVLSQTLSEDGDIQRLAEKYDISTGKAALIQSVLAQNPSLLFEDLTSLSINELNLLSASKEGNTPPITSTGSASDKAYIGYDRAKSIALEHAGVAAGNAVSMQAELDWEDGRMVYEVEFFAGTKEYEYDIDATTGTIHKFKVDEHQQTSGDDTSITYITAAKAKESALNHAGLTDSQISKLEIEFDKDDGTPIYEVEFYNGNTKYEYKIDAETGNIRKFDSKTKKDPVSPPTPDTTPTAKDYISLEKAKEVAFYKAGVTAADIREIKAKFDWDDGLAVYEIEFYKGKTKYEYDIDALTGSIRKADIETKEDEDLPNITPDDTSITAQQAKEIALKHANIPAGEAKKLEVEFEMEDNMTIYKVEFEHGNVEYEYEIDASNGKILSSEKEIDD